LEIQEKTDEKNIINIDSDEFETIEKDKNNE
jgi:hypothetical protein